MAFFKISFFICIVAVYFVTITLSAPQGSGSGLLGGFGGGSNPITDNLIRQRLCSSNSTVSNIPFGSTTLCLICKGFDISCFSSGGGSGSGSGGNTTSTSS